MATDAGESGSACHSQVFGACVRARVPTSAGYAREDAASGALLWPSCSGREGRERPAPSRTEPAATSRDARFREAGKHD